MGRRQQWVYRIQPASFPPDFPERLESLKTAAGLSWRGLARELRVNVRSVNRWRNGTGPGAGHLYALFELAARMELLDLLLPIAEISDDAADACSTASTEETSEVQDETPRRLPHG